MDTQAASTAEDPTQPSGKPVPGHKLIEALKQRAWEDGITTARVAQIVGVSRSYLNSLGYGQRRIPALNRKVLQACADYLAIPYVNVLLLAEVITPSDFMRGANANCRADLVRAMTFIESDPKLRGFASDWQRLDNAALLLIVQLYEKATNTNLLERSMDVVDALKGLSRNRH